MGLYALPYVLFFKDIDEHTDNDTFYVQLYLYDDAANSSFSM